MLCSKAEKGDDDNDNASQSAMENTLWSKSDYYICEDDIDHNNVSGVSQKNKARSIGGGCGKLEQTIHNTVSILSDHSSPYHILE